MEKESWIHDEDSDRPNEIDDYERPLTEDEEEMENIFYGTLDDLEQAVKDPTKPVAEIPMDSALKALQMLRAYHTLFELDLDDYNHDYSEDY